VFASKTVGHDWNLFIHSGCTRVSGINEALFVAKLFAKLFAKLSGVSTGLFDAVMRLVQVPRDKCHLASP
jgi:hypothetical protein